MVFLAILVFTYNEKKTHEVE